MKKTAMQLLIEFMHGAYSVHDIHKKATELLETEREQIEEAANFGITRLHIMEDAEQYYKDMYE